MKQIIEYVQSFIMRLLLSGSYSFHPLHGDFPASPSRSSHTHRSNEFSFTANQLEIKPDSDGLPNATRTDLCPKKTTVYLQAPQTIFNVKANSWDNKDK